MAGLPYLPASRSAARRRPEDLGLVRSARRSHNQLGLAYQIAFIRLTGRAPGQQPFEILEDLVGYVPTAFDPGPLDPVVNRKERTIHLDWITEHWDRIGQFFSAFASGQTTASVALKRLVGHGPKNRFYRATRELGRVFKTEFILDYLSQPALRSSAMWSASPRRFSGRRRVPIKSRSSAARR